MASSTPARSSGPAPSLAALSDLSLSDGVDGGGDPPGDPLQKLPAVGARVRCKGLTGAAGLNGCLGRVVSHAGARARLLMDGPDCRVVGVRPQNLVVVVGLLDILGLSDLFSEEGLRRLDPTDVALLRRVNRGFRTAVESSSDSFRVRVRGICRGMPQNHFQRSGTRALPRAGASDEVPLTVDQFVGSVGLLTWVG